MYSRKIKSGTANRANGGKPAWQGPSNRYRDKRDKTLVVLNLNAMGTMLFVLLCVISTVGLGRAQKVLELTSDNFYDTMNENSLVLVSFYAPWCGYCESLNEVLRKVAKSLHERNEELQNLVTPISSEGAVQAVVCKFDGSKPAHADIVQNEEVSGYPTIYIYKQGRRFAEYQGVREEKPLLEYILRKAGYVVEPLTHLEQLAPNLAQLQDGELLDTGVLCIVLGAFISGDIAYMEEMFKEVAMNFEAGLFYLATHSRIPGHFGLLENTVIVYTGEDQDIYHLIQGEKLLTSESIYRALLSATLPLSLPYSTSTLPLLQSLPVPYHALIFYDGDEDGLGNSGIEKDEKVVEMILSVLAEYKGRILGVEVSSAEYPLLHHFDLRPSDLPQLIVIDRGNNSFPKRYVFSDYLANRYGSLREEIFREQGSNIHNQFLMKQIVGEEETTYYFNSTFLHDFFSEFLEKNLLPSLLSENESVATDLNRKSNFGSRVENIVGSQFESKVLGNDEENILVYFHSSWCLFCKITDIIVADVADKFHNDPTFRVFRMDGSKNEVHHPQVDINAFPKVYFFPAHRKRDVAFYFDGDRTTLALTDFVAGLLNPVEQGREIVEENPVNVDAEL